MRMALRTGLLLLILLMLGCAQHSGRGRKIDPAESHYIRGASYLRENDPSRALQEFAKAEKAAPWRADVQGAMGQAYQQKKAYDRAEKHYLRALKLSSGDPVVRSNLGVLYLDMGAWDKALDAFQKASDDSRFDNPEMALTGLGVAWWRKGDREKAGSCFLQAIEMRGDCAPAYFYMGEIHRENGNLAEAKANYRQALELVPQYMAAWRGLGLVYAAEGNVGTARGIFSRIVEDIPGTEMAEECRRMLRSLPKK
ncbi:MAG: tetratricopeptide repeat protein [Deltaproteobacteria bacterium]|nr:tetratricopeptide repeat protein [Deltaproteobacteria bacterium]